jgi:hypothetical protein
MRAKPEIWLLAVWAALAAWVISLPIPALLGQSILIDDTFYALSAARHLAAGNGSTVDGLHATNGYQPLWVWILACVTALGRLGPDATVRAALVLCALCTAGAGLRLARLTRECGGSDAAAAMAAALWFMNPYLLRRQMNGLESVLAAWLLLEVVGAAQSACRTESAGSAADPPSSRAMRGWRSDLTVGGLAGLAALARVDLLVIGPLLALRRRWLAAVTALTVAIPWLGWSWVKFGSPIPMSGEANRTLFRVLLGRPAGGLWLWDPGTASFTLASLFGLGWPAQAADLAGFPSALGWVAVPAALALPLGLAVLGGGGRERLRAFWRAVRPLAFWTAGPALCFGIAYALLFPAPWHLNRYFLPLHALWIAWAALFFDRAITAPPGPAARNRDPGGAEVGSHRPSSRVVLWWGAYATGLLAGLFPYVVDATGGQTPARQLEVARWIRERVPPEVRVGTVQSGVVGYYAGRPVVNLDGKVNPLAMRALREGRMWDYLGRERIDLFGDWQDLVERCVFGRAGSPEARERAARLPPVLDGVPSSPFAFYRVLPPSGESNREQMPVHPPSGPHR